MENPLVSIPVITYNSSAYIIDGLESIKNQTYKNIELVISDDCSTDNTVEICQKWLSDNKDFFKRAIIITAEKNTGVAGNLNRAIRECQGKWIKVLSGDDKFFPYTINEYVNFIYENNNINVCFGKMKLCFDSDIAIESTTKIYNECFKEIKNSHDQYQRYLKHHYVPGPGLFYKKTIWERIGGFDEKYPFCEEIPFTLNLLESGEIIYFLDKYVYDYNIHVNSLSNNNKPDWRNFRDKKNFFLDVKIKKMIKNRLTIYAYDELLSYYLIQYSFFEESFFLKNIIKLLKLTSPLYIYNKTKSLFSKK